MKLGSVVDPDPHGYGTFNGFGIIVIFYHDGKGHGFGNYVLNQNSTT